MKKMILILFTNFLLINQVGALTIEEELTKMKNSINSLSEEVDELENTRLDKMYPIGSIYVTTTYSSASQVASAIGGTWEAYGSGKTLVGVNTSDTNFSTVGKTGGSSTTTLSNTNLPSHSHSIPALSGTAASAGSHSHSIPALSGTAASAGSHTHSLSTWVFNGVNESGGINRYGMAFQATGDSSVRTGVDTSLENSWGIYSAGAHTHQVTTVANTTGSNGAHTHSVTTTANTSGNSGSGTAFTNLQPYITVYMYKRVS